MYLGSDEFNNAIENTSGNAPKIRVTLEDGTTLDNIKSIKFYGGSNDSDDVSIGTTNMARIDVTAFTDRLLTNNEIFLEQGIELANGVVEYMPIGYFTIQKPQGDIDEVRFTAYDRMQKFEKPYSSSLAYPTTSALILNELCQICGIELATTLDNAIEVTENLKGYTCREVLGYIASMHGYFACIDRYGKLNVRWYSDTPIEKSLKKIWHFEKSQDNFEIAKIEIVKDSETKYERGNGITTLHNSNPLATQEITDDIFAKLGGFSYSISEIEMLDDARLDPWDMVSVEYYDGKTYNIPCMTLEHDFKAYSTTVKSVGKSESENEYRFTGPTIQYLNRMAAELLVANRVIATKVDAEYVNSHAITTDNLDAIKAEIQTLVVEEIDGKYATIDFANIDVANINKTNIGLLFAEVGLIDRATIVDGHITGFLDAVEVNANKITAGTLIADRILLSGEKGSVLYALNNLGELTSTNVDTLDGYVLTDRTINADKLIANSITANELDVAEIFANSTVTNTLFAQDITATGTITGATLIGANAEIDEGYIGKWNISDGKLVANIEQKLINNFDILKYKVTEYEYNGDDIALRKQRAVSINNKGLKIEYVESANDEETTELYPGATKEVFLNEYTEYTENGIVAYRTQLTDEGYPYSVISRIDFGVKNNSSNMVLRASSMEINNVHPLEIAKDANIGGNLVASKITTSSGADLDTINSNLAYIYYSSDDVTIETPISNTSLGFWVIEYKDFIIVSIKGKMNDTINSDAWTTLVSGLPEVSWGAPLNFINTSVQTRNAEVIYSGSNIILITSANKQYVNANEGFLINGIAMK